VLPARVATQALKKRSKSLLLRHLFSKQARVLKTKLITDIFLIQAEVFRPVA
jgi:hypothetical protein